MPIQHPCRYPKHSYEQLECLRGRAEREEPMFHPHDCQTCVTDRDQLDAILEKIRLIFEAETVAKTAERKRQKKRSATKKWKACNGGKKVQE